MNASKFRRAQKAFILKKGEQGTLVTMIGFDDVIVPRRHRCA